MPMIKTLNLENLLLDTYFKEIVVGYQSALREVVSVAVKQGIPVPSFSSALLIMIAIVQKICLQI